MKKAKNKTKEYAKNFVTDLGCSKVIVTKLHHKKFGESFIVNVLSEIEDESGEGRLIFEERFYDEIGGPEELKGLISVLTEALKYKNK